MKSAVITPCGHFFHAGCLKKWLYVQESCPLCHGTLKGQSPSTSPSAPAPPDTSPANPNAEQEEQQDLVPGEKATQAGESSSNVATQSGMDSRMDKETMEEAAG